METSNRSPVLHSAAMRRHREDWERFGAIEPYFAVLTDNRFRQKTLTSDSYREFYETGERDVDRFLALVREARGRPAKIRRALDFGCGVGRVSIPLARHAANVVGVDVSAAMLERAADAARSAEVPNIEFLSVDALATVDASTFDLVVSYMVFQHIPPRDTEVYLEEIFRVAASDAALVLHFSLSRSGGRARRIMRSLRSRSRLIHRLVCFLRREEHFPYMQMNEYNRVEIERTLNGAGFEVRIVEPTDHGGIAGAIFVAVRG